MSIEEYFKDWIRIIDRKELDNIVNTLNTLYRCKYIEPAYKDIFKAFHLCDYNNTKVIFLGQDPYPQKDVATGLLFANKPMSKVSPSLEVLMDACMGDILDLYDFDVTLESWAKQGILLLNSALTVERNNIGSHIMLWRPFISKFFINFAAYNTGIIYVLFGKQAQTFEPYINKRYNTVFKVPHPSYYVRTKSKMPPSLFKEIKKEVLYKFNTTINWYKLKNYD